MYDLIVIGAGPGGYTAAIRAAQKGLKVALVEKNKLGGTCINVGCIPTKVYSHASSLINDIHEAEAFGIEASYNFNFNKLVEKKNKVVEELNFGLKYLMENNKIDVIYGEAKFINENSIAVNDEIYESEAFIIATGSQPIIPEIDGVNMGDVITSKQALEMTNIPENLVVVGGGVIGLEFATIFKSLGSNVTIVEMLPDLLPSLDRDVVEAYKDIICSKNIELMLGSKVVKIEEGLKVKVIIGENKEKVINCDKVLIAVGRKPNINGVDNLNLKTEKRGIQVNSFMQTNIKNIFCIGDVNGISQLAHVATYQADIAVNNITGKECEADFKAIPSCVYSDPEISYVGINEEQAREKYDNVKIGIFPYSYSGRAKTMGQNQGLVKVISGTEYDQILGVQIVGKEASEIIHEGVLALKYDFSAHEIIDNIHAHPTLTESFKEACDDLFNLSVNKD